MWIPSSREWLVTSNRLAPGTAGTHGNFGSFTFGSLTGIHDYMGQAGGAFDGIVGGAAKQATAGANDV